jgi:hypothetical protein
MAWKPIVIPVSVHLRILVYSGGYYVELLESSKCRGFKIVSGIILNCHMDKLVTGNKHLITCTYLGQDIIFSSHLQRFEIIGVI